MKKRILELLLRKDIEYIELMSSLGLVGWSIALLANSHILELQTYSSLKSLSSSVWVWSFVTLLLGFIQLFALFQNIIELRRSFTLIVMFFWTFISVAFALTGALTGTAIYSVFSLGCILVYLRLTILNILR